MKWIIIGSVFLFLGLIGMSTHSNSDDLTPAQKLAIYDHCNQHPDAWDCRG